MDRLFTSRHAVTAADPHRHEQFADRGSLRIAITGATGFIGSALVAALSAAGHTVHRLVRSERRRRPGDVLWDPAGGRLDPRALEGIDAIIHLAGEPIAQRWTAAAKRRIRESRVRGTELLSTTIASLTRPPRVMVSGSAMGIYGDRGDEVLDETSPLGSGFLADVAREWEAASYPAAHAGVRVVHIRTGLVLSPRGGALPRMMLPFQVGAGGRLGDGTQWMAPVALDDVVGALHVALMEDAIRGAVNVVLPAPVRNAEFAETLGRVLRRPSFAAAPAFALRLALGRQQADEMVLASQRVVPRALLAAGFAFRHPTLEAALRFELGRG